MRGRAFANAAKAAALLVVATGVALVAAEGLLRALAPIRYSTALEYRPDGHLGARLVADRRYTLHDGGTVTVNRLGFRGSERLDWEKPAGAFRLVALGGSSTFCYQTDDAGIWTRLLELRLRERFGAAVQVVNAGTPGYGSFESKVHYLYRVRNLDPDAVLVYHGWNDLKRLRRVEARLDPVSKGVYRAEPLKAFARGLQLSWRLRALVQGRAPGSLPPRAEDALPEAGDAPIAPGGRAHTWVRRNYRDLALLLRADDVLPVFVSQASLVSRETLAREETRQRIYAEYTDLAYEELLQQTLAVRALVRGVAAEQGALYVDGYAALPHALSHFHDHVHLTSVGNAALADALGEALQADPRFVRRLRAALAAPPRTDVPPAGACPHRTDVPPAGACPPRTDVLPSRACSIPASWPNAATRSPRAAASARSPSIWTRPSRSRSGSPPCGRSRTRRIAPATSTRRPVAGLSTPTCARPTTRRGDA